VLSRLYALAGALLKSLPVFARGLSMESGYGASIKPEDPRLAAELESLLASSYGAGVANLRTINEHEHEGLTDSPFAAES